MTNDSHNLEHPSPTWKAILGLVVLQITCSALIILILQLLNFLNFQININAWINMLGLLVGAQVFGFLWEVRKLHSLKPHYSRLSFFASLIHIGIALSYFAVTQSPFFRPGVISSPKKLILTAVFTLSIAGLLSFALTRLGLATGILMKRGFKHPKEPGN